MNPLYVSVLFALTVLAGAFAGGYARGRLPRHHQNTDTKDMVKIGVGFLGTLAALVLGLVVASAKASFDTKTAEIQTAAGKILQVDRSLSRLGTQAEHARKLLRELIAQRVGHLGEAPPAAGGGASATDRMLVALRSLSPQDEAQRSALERAVALLGEVDEINSLALAQTGSSITMPLLVLLVLWFTVIMAGWNLFTPHNATTLAVNLLCALSLGGAIFLLLEMDQPFGGVIRVSDEPLRAILTRMGP